MLLSNALERIPVIDCLGDVGVRISGISYDSRSVREGHLFVAVKGEKTDGNRFVQQAIRSGVAAVASEHMTGAAQQKVAAILVEDARRFLAEISRVFFDDPAEKLTLTAITGTNGKTTTSYLMESIFESAGLRSCLIGTIGMKIGDRSCEARHTTPEAPDLTIFLKQAVEQGCTHGALEVSSHALVLKRVFGTRFKVGIFTNLTQDHLDFHRDMESYYQAKRLLFSSENENRVEHAVINIDNPYGRRLVSETDCPAMSFGFDAGAAIHVVRCENHVDATDLTLKTPAGEITFHAHMIGKPNVYNVMAATGAALCQGLAPEQIRNGVEALRGVPGRVERVKTGQDFSVIVDYAHSPDALENLLNTISGLPHSRLILVFGCGGDRDKGKRPIMGEIAAGMSDLVVATSDNPRSEDPLQILRDIEAGLSKGPAQYVVEPDRRKAIDSAISLAAPGDVVVIAGKGHENYQILEDRTVPFDDARIAEELIRKRELERKDVNTDCS